MQIKNGIKQNALQFIIGSVMLPFGILIAVIRLIPIVILLSTSLLHHQFVYPLLSVFPRPVQRFFSSYVNLICLRTVLFFLGVKTVTNEGFQYFVRRNYIQGGVWKANNIMNFKSGWVGVGVKQNFIDFLYYAYLYNPIFVRIVQHFQQQQPSNEEKSKIFYIKLTFRQALFAALSQNGFDPIITKSKRQFRKLQGLKYAMNNLIIHCHDEIKGPIIVILPQFSKDCLLKVNNQLQQSIQKNQQLFTRQGVAFYPKIAYQQSQKNQQIYVTDNYKFILKQCLEFKFKKIYVNFEKINSRLYSPFMYRTKADMNNNSSQSKIDAFYSKKGFKMINMSFQKYNQQKKQKKQDQNSVKLCKQKQKNNKHKNKNHKKKSSFHRSGKSDKSFMEIMK